MGLIPFIKERNFGWDILKVLTSITAVRPLQTSILQRFISLIESADFALLEINSPAACVRNFHYSTHAKNLFKYSITHLANDQVYNHVIKSK